MDSTWLDTSLDLNLNLLNPRCEFPKRECFEGDHHEFAEYEEKSSVKQEVSLVEELNRMNNENKELSKMLSMLCENYNNLQKQYLDLTMTIKSNSENNNSELNGVSKKRKRAAAESDHHHRHKDDYNTDMIGFNSNYVHTECSTTTNNDTHTKQQPAANKVSRVYVRTTATNSTLSVKDGYQWRKYGQKVTRDNPSPRAYFKCSFAPSCPVKKKVQRSASDPSILVADYEGEHNHPQPSDHSKPDRLHQLSSLSPTRTSYSKRSPAGALHDQRTQPAGLAFDDAQKPSSPVEEIEAPGAGIQNILVQQMASTLTRDPNFAAALAAAISGRFFDQVQDTATEKWSRSL